MPTSRPVGLGDMLVDLGIYDGDGRTLVAPTIGDVVRYQDVSRTPHAMRRIVA